MDLGFDENAESGSSWLLALIGRAAKLDRVGAGSGWNLMARPMQTGVHARAPCRGRAQLRRIADMPWRLVVLTACFSGSFSLNAWGLNSGQDENWLKITVERLAGAWACLVGPSTAGMGYAQAADSASASDSLPLYLGARAVRWGMDPTDAAVLKMYIAADLSVTRACLACSPQYACLLPAIG